MLFIRAFGKLPTMSFWGCCELNDAEQWLCLLLHTYLIVPFITLEKQQQHRKWPGRQRVLQGVHTYQRFAARLKGYTKVFGDRGSTSEVVQDEPPAHPGVVRSAEV